MKIGVLQIEILVTDAMSLKDKRRVVKSIKDRIANGHNVSIAEIGALDEHRARSWEWPWSGTTGDMSKAH